MINRKDMVIPPSFETYTNRVKEADPLKAIYTNTKAFRKLLDSIPKSKASYAYAEGKWTLKEMLQHIIDAERVFAFRALHFARKDAAPLPPFDENSWAANSKANTRKWKDLIREFFELRSANERLFTSLDEEQMRNSGVANNNPISVAALALVIAGHLDHHIAIIQERYLQPYPAATGNGTLTRTGKKKTAEKKGKDKKAGKKNAANKKEISQKTDQKKSPSKKTDNKKTDKKKVKNKSAVKK